MKTRSLCTCLIVLFLLAGSNYCQDSFTIPESGETIICGRTVIVDGIWSSEGIIRADISILETPRSKPITGGYMAGDMITISSEPGCTYYINTITKSGKDSSKGMVILSANPLVQPIQQCADDIIFDEGQSYKIDTLDWHIDRIGDSESGKPAVYINATYLTEKISEFTLTEYEKVWISGCLYEVRDIMPCSKFIKTDPDKIYEPLPGSLRLRKIK